MSGDWADIDFFVLLVNFFALLSRFRLASLNFLKCLFELS